MTTLHEAAALSRDEQGLVVLSTLRANGTIQSSLVNAGILAHPATGETILAVVAAGPPERGSAVPRFECRWGTARSTR